MAIFLSLPFASVVHMQIIDMRKTVSRWTQAWEVLEAAGLIKAKRACLCHQKPEKASSVRRSAE